MYHWYVCGFMSLSHVCMELLLEVKVLVVVYVVRMVSFCLKVLAANLILNLESRESSLLKKETKKYVGNYPQLRNQMK